MNYSNYSAVEFAIQALQQGKMIILTDPSDRENEGDFVFPAEIITAEIMNFMIQHGSGIVCISLFKEQLDRLQLPLILSPEQNTTPHKIALAVPVDAKEGVTTGVSASDRTKTIHTLMDFNTQPADLIRPGHVYPLQAHSDGVLARNGHTEGSMDIVRIAGFKPGAVICEVMNSNGDTRRGHDLLAFAQQWDIPLLAIDDLIHYRKTIV